MFRPAKSWAIALLGFIFACQLSALAAEVAVLRNGYSIPHLRREQKGDITRLYTADGYIDIPTEQIASFEAEETPAPKAQETAQPAPQPQQSQPAPTPVAATAAPQAQPVANTTKPDLDMVVREASTRQRIDPDFVNSVIKAESNFYPHAVSPKGAQGLMQLMPGTAAKLGVRNAFDPKANVEAGTTYLSQLLDLYDGDAIRALAAYNAGPQRVEQYHGVPPYRETRLYIARIVRDYNAKKAKQKPSTLPVQSTTKQTSSHSPHRKPAARKTAGEKQASLSQTPAGAK